VRMEIYASNLKQGGALSVAAGFLSELPAVLEENSPSLGNYSLKIFVSRQIAEQVDWIQNGLYPANLDLVVRDAGVIRMFFHNILHAVDVRFSIFGPTYFLRKAHRELMGFADGSLVPVTGIAKSIKQISNPFTVTNKIRELRGKIKIIFLRRADEYVVQTTAMQQALTDLGVSKKIHVVNNVASQILYTPAMWEKVDLPERFDNEIRLFFPARGYAHKNHIFLLQISQEFEKISKQQLKFVVTLRDDELQSIFSSNSDSIINVGEINVKQVAYIYSVTDGLVFPSLNETSSSAPLEAEALGKPIIATDLPFMREMLEGIEAKFASIENPHLWAVEISKLADSKSVKFGQQVAYSTKPRQQARQYFDLLSANR